MYNSTPHTITGKTPSELFFRRQFRDKIPSAENFSKVTKIMPDYEDSEHTVISKQGGDVLIKNDNSGQLYRRNIVHLKKVEGKWKICNE
nr:unnamed protein product [Callosobruchus chinensis]